MAEQDNQEILPTTNPKKEHSYTYWVDEKNKSRDLPEEHKPKKIETPLFVTDKYISPQQAWQPQVHRNGTLLERGNSALYR
jgi:hypothetical protein